MAYIRIFVTSKNGPKNMISSTFIRGYFLFVPSDIRFSFLCRMFISFILFFFNSSFLNARILLFSIQLVFSHLDISFTFVMVSIYSQCYLFTHPVFRCFFFGAFTENFFLFRWSVRCFAMDSIDALVYYTALLCKRDGHQAPVRISDRLTVSKIPIFSTRINEPIN